MGFPLFYHDDVLERLKSVNKKLFNLLKKEREGLAGEVAEMIAHTLAATDKFNRFVKNFLPDPPGNRPDTWMQVDWSSEHMEDMIGKIYDHRSKALHTGRPFPLPMCQAPRTFGVSSNNYPSEKPAGLAARAMGATWHGDDTPMLLHVFEYIVRHALLGWCKSMSEQGQINT